MARNVSVQEMKKVYVINVEVLFEISLIIVNVKKDLLKTLVH